MLQILLVDDDPAVRAVIRGYLSKLTRQAKLHEAPDGKSGLVAVNNTPMDCLLVDCRLPDMDGLSFVKSLSKLKNITDAPIIMLSGVGNEVIAADSIKSGAVDYLAKSDLTPNVLLRAIKNAIELVRTRQKRKKAESALIVSEARYRNLFENVNDLIQSISPEGHLLYANRAWCKNLGYEVDEFKNRSIFEIIHPDYQAHCKAAFKQLLSGGSVSIMEVKFITKDGQELLVEGNVNCQFRQGKPVATRGIFRNITARRDAEQKVNIEKERLQVTLHSIGDAVITTDADGQIDFMNPVAETLSGWLLEEVQNKPVDEVFKIFTEDAQEPILNPVMQCLRDNQLVMLPDNTVLINRHGNRYAIQDSAAPIRTEAGEILGAVMVFRDVSEAREMVQKIHHQSRHDPLTGLLNRREFELHLKASLESAKNENSHHVLCFLDLDNFKIVNDTAGHAAGDALLRQVSDLLGNRLRKSDFLARMGGDEFCILLESCPLEKAQSIADDIISSIREQRFNWDKKIYEAGVSIGIVPITQDSESTSQVLSCADIACYTAKGRGRNQAATYYAEDNDATSVRRYGDLLRAASLHEALENDNFCLYAQAIKGIAADSVSYELLIRMYDDKGNILLPGMFIPAAERFNLIGAIDRWVIKTALQEYFSVFGKDQKVKIGINLSGNSLIDDDMLEFILAEFASSGVPPECVCFEITETAAISYMREARKLIKALKDHGCSIALDDFGSGMSSFNYLKQFPIDYLKIDGSFMKGIVNDPVDRAMVESINRIGHVMGIQTIAEWVESEEILNQLKIIGVDYAQGFAIGYPEPFEKIGLKPRELS